MAVKFCVLSMVHNYAATVFSEDTLLSRYLTLRIFIIAPIYLLNFSSDL